MLSVSKNSVKLKQAQKGKAFCYIYINYVGDMFDSNQSFSILM